MLQKIYYCLGAIAVIALVFSIIMEWRQKRLRQVLYGVGLLLLMSLLFFIHLWVTAGATIV